MKIKLLTIAFFSLAILLFHAPPSQAHFVWIEAPTVGKTGEEIPVNVFFGEYHEGVREKRGGRLDNRKGLELQAISPSGKQSGPLTWNEEENRFSGKLKLTEPGIYDLVGTDAKSLVVDYTKYGIGVVRPMFYARTRILSFQDGLVSKNVRKPEPRMGLDILPVTRHLDHMNGKFGPAPKEEMVYQIYFNGKPLTQKADILIYAPNGWMWEGKADSEGTGRFSPLWPGTYVIDVVFKEQVPGNFMGKPYELVRHRSTLTLAVPSAADAK